MSEHYVTSWGCGKCLKGWHELPREDKDNAIIQDHQFVCWTCWDKQVMANMEAPYQPSWEEDPRYDDYDHEEEIVYLCWTCHSELPDCACNDPV